MDSPFRATRVGQPAHRRLSLLFVSGFPSACVAGPERVSVPVEKASVAQVGHVELARFWGDEVKPTLRALIVQQYTRTSDAVRSGRRLATVARHRKPKSDSIGTLCKCFLPWERKKGVLDTGVRILL